MDLLKYGNRYESGLGENSLTSGDQRSRPRASDLGISLGLLPRGENNSITDVEGVKVGHSTIISGEGQLRPGEGPIRTGLTIILPHSSNLFRQKVPAAVHSLNSFGKSLGLMQIMELGRLESPIALTGTLNVWNVANSIVDYTIEYNPGIQSFNPVVMECNDRFLNDAIGRHVNKDHVVETITNASSPNVQEGNVGAGTGMSAFGWKAGIGTSSRICESLQGIYKIGVLTLCNMGHPKDLRIGHLNAGHKISPPGTDDESGGSVCFVIATDAPLTSRQLDRLARRSHMGLARTGAIVSHGNGSFALSFSNSPDRPEIDDAHLTPLLRGVVEATEEAIINSILQSETMTGRDGNIRHSIPITDIENLLKQGMDRQDRNIADNTNLGIN